MNLKTPYGQIVNANNIAEVIVNGERENLPPAHQDCIKRLLLVIDMQNDFMEGLGTLPVPGSKSDVERLNCWIYNHANKLTHILCSLDTHAAAQIFHPCWWKNRQGAQPSPFTIITHDDVLNGNWIPVNNELGRTLEYLSNLETTGKKQLCIWPYHCLEGTFGANLESAFTRMLYFHAAARHYTPTFITKGLNPWTEMYGIIRAEYDPQGFVNSAILDAMEQADEVYIAGEASSHCVLASVEQILAHFAHRPDVTNRIILLEDCMSPVTGFEETTNKAFASMQELYGVRMVISTETIP